MRRFVGIDLGEQLVPDKSKVAPEAVDLTQFKNKVNRRPTPRDEMVDDIRSRTRAKVEHGFGFITCVFEFWKVRHRSLAKSAKRLMTAAALCNLYRVRRKLV
jgi:transposase, IS5 family